GARPRGRSRGVLGRIRDGAAANRGGAGVRRAGRDGERAIPRGNIHEGRGAGVATGDALIRADLDLDHLVRAVVADRAAGLGERRARVRVTAKEVIAGTVGAVADRGEALQILLELGGD